MVTCRTIDEVLAAADADEQRMPPMSQEAADLVAAILASRGYTYAAAPREQAPGHSET